MRKQGRWAHLLRLGVKRNGGYTFIEVLIFLAVTMFLFAASVTLISRQQRRTEFQQSVNDLRSVIQTVINDVATGFYPNTTGFRCQANYSSGGGISFVSDTGTDNSGKNSGCIFIGKVVQFGVGGDANKLAIYTVAGRRFYADSTGETHEVDSLSRAAPRAVLQSGIVDLTDRRTFLNGVEVVSMKNGVITGSNNVGAIAIYNVLSPLGVGVDVNGGSGQSQILDAYALKGTTVNVTESDMVSAISNPDAKIENIDDTNGIQICMRDNNQNYFVKLTIGGSGRGLSANLALDQDKDCGG